MPNQITDLLDDIDRLDADAEAGPWDLEPAVETQNGWSLGTVRSNTTGESIAADIYNSDGALIALSRTALPALAQAVRAVLKECESFEIAHDDSENAFHEGVQWTVKAIRQGITDALGG